MAKCPNGHLNQHIILNIILNKFVQQMYLIYGNSYTKLQYVFRNESWCIQNRIKH